LRQTIGASGRTPMSSSGMTWRRASAARFLPLLRFVHSASAGCGCRRFVGSTANWLGAGLPPGRCSRRAACSAPAAQEVHDRNGTSGIDHRDGGRPAHLGTANAPSRTLREVNQRRDLQARLHGAGEQHCPAESRIHVAPAPLVHGGNVRPEAPRGCDVLLSPAGSHEPPSAASAGFHPRQPRRARRSGRPSRLRFRLTPAVALSGTTTAPIHAPRHSRHHAARSLTRYCFRPGSGRRAQRASRTLSGRRTGVSDDLRQTPARDDE
jgi:hypothetical protein